MKTYGGYDCGDTCDTHSLTRYLGRGEFSHVWKTSNGVIKIYTTRHSGFTYFENEIRMLSLANSQPTTCPHILKIIGFGCTITDNYKLQPYIIVDEWQVSVITMIRQNTSGLPTQLAMTLTREMFTALTYLHGIDMVHGDVKPHNLMVNFEDGVAHSCLIDFGSAYLRSISGGFGTLQYSAPEELTESECGWQVDIWAAMITCFEMFTADLLFDVHAETRIIYDSSQTRKSPVDTNDTEVSSSQESDSTSDTGIASHSDDAFRYELFTLLRRVIGRPPKEFRVQYPDVYTKKGDIAHTISPERCTTLREVIALNQYAVPRPDLFIEFLKCGIAYLPCDRKPAQRCKNHEFLN